MHQMVQISLDMIYYCIEQHSDLFDNTGSYFLLFLYDKKKSRENIRTDSEIVTHFEAFQF